jgi:hypothetical protein
MERTFQKRASPFRSAQTETGEGFALKEEPDTPRSAVARPQPGLTGKFTPTTASCTGTAKQAPDLAFEAVLVRMAD